MAGYSLQLTNAPSWKRVRSRPLKPERARYSTAPTGYQQCSPASGLWGTVTAQARFATPYQPPTPTSTLATSATAAGRLLQNPPTRSPIAVRERSGAVQVNHASAYSDRLRVERSAATAARARNVHPARARTARMPARSAAYAAKSSETRYPRRRDQETR